MTLVVQGHIDTTDLWTR